MRVDRCLECQAFPCRDVKHEAYQVPCIALDPGRISVAMVSEAAPADAHQYFYAAGEPLFGRTTVQAFRDAGADVSAIKDVVDRGVYLTTAVKCAKKGYGVETATIERCSLLLEKELSLFPRLKVILLMGDVAIKALNAIARRVGLGRAIPPGSTYKVRRQDHSFRGMRIFPSYLQAGASFFIEKSKRRMIAEDIRAALRLVS
jgi:uracil-DNA glycosylase